MDRGWDVALVTDAGTPALSDPGEQLVAAAIAAGHEVVPIPGPAAAIAALVASGLPTREFTFIGFPEKKSGARRRELERLLGEGRTIVLYESPYRVGDLLADLAAVAPNARVAVARELTKMHEEIARGSATDLAEHYASDRPKGEITVVIAPANDAGGRRGDPAIGALGSAAATYDGDIQKLARDLLTRPALPLEIAVRRGPVGATVIAFPSVGVHTLPVVLAGSGVRTLVCGVADRQARAVC